MMFHPMMQEGHQRDEHTDGGHQVPHVEPVAVAVGVGAPGHALQARDVHRAEGEVEADEHHPEADLAHALSDNE
jgi:hypothetical protein